MTDPATGITMIFGSTLDFNIAGRVVPLDHDMPCSRLLKNRNLITSAIHPAWNDFVSTLPFDQQSFRSAGRGLFRAANGLDGIAAQPQAESQGVSCAGGIRCRRFNRWHTA